MNELQSHESQESFSKSDLPPLTGAIVLRESSRVLPEKQRTINIQQGRLISIPKAESSGIKSRKLRISCTVPGSRPMAIVNILAINC